MKRFIIEREMTVITAAINMTVHSMVRDLRVSTYQKIKINLLKVMQATFYPEKYRLR